MSYVILIPGILCIIALIRGNTQRVFLDLFIPVMMLFPLSYVLKIPHFPSLDFLTALTLPLGIAMFFGDFSRWKISRTDIWIALFIFTAIYVDYKAGRTIDAIFVLFSHFTGVIVPYMAGKLLVERPGNRIATIRGYVTLLAFVSVFMMLEFFTKINVFRVLWNKFFPEQWWVLILQIRNGFGRAKGPYAQSEHAGNILFIGLTFAVWLLSQRYRKPGGKIIPVVSPAKGKAMVVLLATALYMTLSRGPWIGAIVSLSIASIGKAKRPKKRAVIVFALALLIGLPAYVAGKNYVSGPRADYGSEQETAQYRALLIDNYVPIAKLGGAWGWAYGFPVISGQTSIDNEYLFIWVTQGYVGLTALILIFVETTILLIRLGIKARSQPDRYFVFSVLGVFLGLAVTLGTVYLDFQPRVIFFLLVGWSQAIRLSNKNDRDEEAPVMIQQHAPETALIRVYT
jgi:O-Antigen ligase